MTTKTLSRPSVGISAGGHAYMGLSLISTESCAAVTAAFPYQQTYQHITSYQQQAAPLSANSHASWSHDNNDAKCTARAHCTSTQRCVSVDEYIRGYWSIDFLTRHAWSYPVLYCGLVTDALQLKSSAGDVNKGQQLQGLPAELLDAVLRQLDASSQLQVFMTSKFLATALLRICPRIQLTYPTQHDIIGEHLRELAPFLTEVLQNRRQPKLHLTLQPASSLTDAIEQLPLCGAVNSLAISWQWGLHLLWEPEFSLSSAQPWRPPFPPLQA
ncbi:hypothetical protein HaLaN_16967 [Haematococcus lacustris]|uniref:F-box domain-containing protein n=1 Tax=Haematococcus lacustris TaxID=44745 RepID=A0A699ZBC1_HAELA|nr:hypothetical protein HaLaN_16967 [Haematococcus lacustris]